MTNVARRIQCMGFSLTRNVAKFCHTSDWWCCPWYLANFSLSMRSRHAIVHCPSEHSHGMLTAMVWIEHVCDLLCESWAKSKSPLKYVVSINLLIFMNINFSTKVQAIPASRIWWPKWTIFIWLRPRRTNQPHLQLIPFCLSTWTKWGERREKPRSSEEGLSMINFVFSSSCGPSQHRWLSDWVIQRWVEQRSVKSNSTLESSDC